MPGYAQDKSLDDLGRLSIEQHKRNLKPLKIAFVYRNEAAVTDGKIVPSQTVRCDDRQRTLHGHDFVIEVAKDVFEAATVDFRNAILHHALCYCGARLDEGGELEFDEITNRYKTFIRKPDVVEFEEVFQVHGAYHKELRDFLRHFADNKKTKKDPDDLVTEDTE
jgi:hypothetical protein